jgi:putative metallopeptidase
MTTKRVTKKAKRVTYRFIPPDSDGGRPLYALLSELVEAHHQEILDARIALAWHLGWKPDVDGRVTLGQCKRVGDLDREISDQYDFVIILREAFWADPHVTDLQRRALLDHELSHASVKYDEKGNPMIDERGRTVYRVRRHDLEEFASIAERYGVWKKDLEVFAQALDRARSQSESWVGYRSLQEQLHTVGLTVPLDTIVALSEAERREVRTWAVLRQECPAIAVPACLASVASVDVQAVAADHEEAR